MMHRIIGAGVPKTCTKLCPLERNDDSVYILLNAVFCQHKDVKDDPAYIREWYPSALQHKNQGKLHLVTSPFTEWAAKLMLFSIHFYSKKNLIRHRSSCIKVGLERLQKDEPNLDAFKQAVFNDDKLGDYELRDADVEKVHLALATFVFYAYTGFRCLE